MSHVVEDLTAFADGALAPERRAAVVRHLEGCAACRGQHERIAGTLAALARLPAPAAPSPSFAPALAARLAALRRPTFAERLAAWRWRLAVPTAAAAALAALLAVRAQGAREADVAANLELLEDYVIVAGLGDVETAEDAEIVAHLHELAGPAGERTP